MFILVTLAFSLALSILQCLILAFVSRSYPSSESIYRLPGMYVISSRQLNLSSNQYLSVVSLLFWFSKSSCLVSFLGTVVRSVEFCIVLDFGFKRSIGREGLF